MLIITLGTIASGSTWVFNVVRALCAEMLPDTVSLSTGDAAELLHNITPECKNLIVKCHNLDTDFLTLAAVSRARMIITTRDPRDSFVSHRERFGATFKDAARSLSGSSATFAMLPDTVDTLELRYEDTFTDRIATVERIAAFLDFQVGPDVVQRIFDAYQPERVGRAVDRSCAKGRLSQTGFDVATHWHAGHVGDRQIGKWRTRLRPDEQEAVIGALGGSLEPIAAPKAAFWAPNLFDYHDDRDGGAEEVLECRGEEGGLVWGPYLYLPTGRWQFTPRLELDGSDPVSIRIDAHIPIPGRDVLSLRVVNLPTASLERLTMEIDNIDHLQPLEFRIATIADGRRGRIRFTGVELEWLGTSERPRTSMAQPVRAAMAPLAIS